MNDMVNETMNATHGVRSRPGVERSRSEFSGQSIGWRPWTSGQEGAVKNLQGKKFQRKSDGISESEEEIVKKQYLKKEELEIPQIEKD